MELYVLADSRDSITYINIMIACLLKNDITRIRILHIEEQCGNYSVLPSLTHKLEDIVNKELDKVSGMIEHEDNKEIIKQYKRLIIILKKEQIEQSLSRDEFLVRLEERKKTNDIILDITTLKKDVLTNLLPYLSKKGFDKKIYYFERKTPWRHDDSDLIHNLKSMEYQYDLLLDEKTITYLKQSNSRFVKRTTILITVIFVILFLVISFLADKIIGIGGVLVSLVGLGIQLFDAKLN